MSRFRFCAFTTVALAIALIVNPLFAQSSEMSENTITVTGQKLENEEAREKALQFVSKHTTRLGNQFARRTVPTCARVVGIDEVYTKIVLEKVNAVGKGAGLFMEGGNCAPNLHILFTTDGNALMEQLRKARPSLFSDVELRKRKALFTKSAPLRWWYVNDAISARDYKSTARANADGTAPITDRTVVSPMISTGFVVDIVGTVVVVDIKQSEGYPLESIAAYAAMVSFAQLRPSDASETTSSIMSMFARRADRASGPSDLTAFDYAYIRGLYAILPDRVGSSQKNWIAGKMAARLTNTATQGSK
jgi:hypothetical protein